MNADTIKAFFTYVTALTIVIGGLAVLYLTRGEASSANLQLIVSGLMGAATTFLFVQENSTRSQRASERQFAQGSASAGSGTTVTNAETVTSGGPTTVTSDELKG